jgi:short-subunit dehydrogenase
VNLRDKVIVITGASSGFGELIARRCAAEGARVVLAARSAERLEQLAAELGAHDGRALAVPVDVTSAADVERLAAATLERFGRADVLVANAGFGVYDRIVDASLADLEEQLAVNVVGVACSIKTFLPDMLRRRSGQVVIMSSLGGLMTTQNMGFYNMSKHALVALGRTLMLELQGTGVRCALICPGVAPTGFQQRADASKYPRFTRLVTCSAEQVAAATVGAIRRRTQGEILIPWYAHVLTTLYAVAPGRVRRFVIGVVK